MGFLLAEGSGNVRQKQEDALLHRLECKVCPFDKMDTGIHHHMKPTGAEKPLLYFIGEAPGKTEADEGEQFIGESGEILRPRIPKDFENTIRWNNVVRCRPPKNRLPERVEIECCRPFNVRDIERTKPKAVVGFGGVPLTWATGWSHVTLWRGRKMPVKIGSHVCWYYPMLHPAYLLRQRRGRGKDDPLAIGSEEERMFVMDLKRIFAEIEDIPDAVVHSSVEAHCGIEIVTECTEAGLKKIKAGLERLAQMSVVGFDYETNSLRPYAKDALILSVAIGSPDYSLSFGIAHPGAKWPQQLLNQLRELLISFIRTYKGHIAVHQLAFELEWTGVLLDKSLLRGPKWEDTVTQAAVIDERRGKSKPGPFALEWLIQQYFGFNIKKLSGVDRKALARTPLDRVLTYNALDAKYHCLLYLKQVVVIADKGLEHTYEMGLRRVSTVVLSQIKGTPVDQDEVALLRAKYEERIEGLEEQIAAHPDVKAFSAKLGHEFNPGSGPEVIELFYKRLGCHECEVEDKKSKEVKLSADADVLEAIKKGRYKQSVIDLAGLFLKWRGDTKLLSTYILPMDESFKDTVIKDDGLMHCVFNTTWAETSRLSAEDPNLQNYPKRGAEAKEVRKPVKAGKGRVVVAVDYGQIEARVIAMFTKDKSFVQALWEDYDVHMEWAERIARAYPARIGGKEVLEGFKLLKDPKHKKHPSVVSCKAFRTDIKNQWTFPLFFNATLPSVAGYLNIPERVIKPEYDAFWREFDGVRNWQEDQVAHYRKHGWVETMGGRRRHGPLTSNQIVNTPIQGTAAEIVLDAMCRLSETGKEYLQPEINIHDDLTYLRVLESEVEDHVEEVVGMMLDVPFDYVNVPITVEVSLGPNWADMEEIAAFRSDKWFK